MSKRKTIHTLAAVAALSALVGLGQAHAQARSQVQTEGCFGKLNIDHLIQNRLSTGGFEYLVQIRNTTAAPLVWRLNFSGFNALNVQLFSPQLDSGGTKLAANSDTTIRFGTGRFSQMNTAMVKVLYDVRRPPAPAIIASNCK